MSRLPNPVSASAWAPVAPQVRVRRLEANIVQFALSGEIDLACVDCVRAAFDGYAPVARHAVVDLASVVFLDATGLGLLCRLRKAVRAHGGRVALVCPNRQPLLALRTADLLRPLEVRPSLAEALQVLRDVIAPPS